AVVVWDWLISLQREWQFIWKSHWTPVKASYLFCRYWVIAVVPYLLYCFVTNHSQEECERIYKIPVILAMWNQVGSESVLLIRTYAFFNRNNYLLCGLVFTLSGVIAFQLYVATSRMTRETFTQGPCFPVSRPGSADLLGFFIAPLGFDTLVTGMTLVKSIGMRRRNGGPSSKLIQTFLREGVFYYILISIANLINGIFYLQPRQVISAINIPLSVMLAPVLACRLILDLRQRGAETVAHSEGSGVGPFTANSGVSTNGKRSKPELFSKRQSQYGSSASASNMIIRGGDSIHPVDLEEGEVELDDMHFEAGLNSAGISTRTLGGASPAPAYDAIDLGFNAGLETQSEDSHSNGGVVSIFSGIRVDVEKTTSSI
ncbi:hypothetical protein CONPUDRAFT_45184, partial [Coniophora puteana RWD-64-598 SS2]